MSVGPHSLRPHRRFRRCPCHIHLAHLDDKQKEEVKKEAESYKLRLEDRPNISELVSVFNKKANRKLRLERMEWDGTIKDCDEEYEELVEEDKEHPEESRKG